MNNPSYVDINKPGNRTPQFVIDQINLKYKISEYLSDKGIHPKTRNGNNLVYHCPLPCHPNDNSPSFYVYDKGTHEDYYCYGCKNGAGIVHFVSKYEGIGIRQAVERLSEGMGINVEDIMDALIMEIISDTDHASPKECLELAFCLNKSLHDYIKAVDFDPVEVEIADKAGRLIEKYLYAENIDGLKKLMSDDSQNGLDLYIRNRVYLFNCRKQEEEIARLKRQVKGDRDGKASQEIMREDG